MRELELHFAVHRKTAKAYKDWQLRCYYFGVNLAAWGDTLKRQS